MASIPGRHDEVKNFVNKFLSLHGVGRKARLDLECHGGQLWVSLHAELGEQPGQAVPLLPQHGAVPATCQTKPSPLRRRRRKGGRPCREARRARRVLATFLSLPFYLHEADETLVVDPVPAPALNSAEAAEANSISAEVEEMDTTPPPPPSPPATSLHASNDEEAVVRRHACRERDARQSLALSETESPPAMTSTSRKKSHVASPAAMPAETTLGCESPDSRCNDISLPSTRERSYSMPSPSPPQLQPDPGVPNWLLLLIERREAGEERREEKRRAAEEKREEKRRAAEEKSFKSS